MRLKGYFTIEASYIFAFITFLIIAFIRLDYKLHDRVLNDSCKILCGIRQYQADAFYYDVNTNHLDYLSIIASPVVGEDEEFKDLMHGKIEQKQMDYYDKANLSGAELNLSNVNEMIKIKKNADTIRAGGKIVNIIGEITNEG